MAPHMALRHCSEPRCSALVRQGRCEKHAHLDPKKFHDKARGTASQRGYGSAWKRLRDQVLREEPLCSVCRDEDGRVEVSTHCDHIVPKAAGGSDERGNLRGMCAYHHRQKTAREAAAIRNGAYRR